MSLTPSEFFTTTPSFLTPTPSYSSPINNVQQSIVQQQPNPQQQQQQFQTSTFPIPTHPIFEQTSNRIPSALQQTTSNNSSNSGTSINIMGLVGNNLTITSVVSSKKPAKDSNSTAAQNNPRNINTAIFQQIHSVVESMQEKEKQQQAQFEKQIIQMIMQQKQRQQQYQQQQQQQQIQHKSTQVKAPIYAQPQLTTSAPLYHPYQRPNSSSSNTKSSLPKVSSEEFLSLNSLPGTPIPAIPSSPLPNLTPQPQQQPLQTDPTPPISDSSSNSTLTAEQQQQLLFQQLMGIQSDTAPVATSLFDDLGDSSFLDTLLGTGNNL